MAVNADSTVARGSAAEDAALALLERSGLQAIARNWRCPGGEIDLVMRDGEVLVFVEVRHRSAAGHGDGFDSVGLRKQQRLIRSARHFLAAHLEHTRATCRFDVVASDGEGLRWIRNAFVVDRSW